MTSMHRNFRRAAISTLSTGVLLLIHGCSGDGAAPASAEAPTEAEIAAYLEAKEKDLQPEITGLRLTDFRYSRDRTVVCGVLRAPGREPEVFASVDTTPMTLDRPIGLPYRAGASTPEADRLARQRVLNDNICERHGLMPSL